MPSTSAGQFVKFAFAGARGKRGLIRRAVARQSTPMPYAMRHDHWWQLRVALQRMIRTGDCSATAISRAAAKFPEDRRATFRAMLESFARHWPHVGAMPGPRPALKPSVNGLEIRSIPHAAVRIGKRCYYVRFVYSNEPPRDLEGRLESQLLRVCALRARARPALLVVRSATLVPPHRDRDASRLLDSETREYVRLWQWAGGS